MMVESLARICRLAMERVAKKSVSFLPCVAAFHCTRDEERILLRGESERLEGAVFLEEEGAWVFPDGAGRVETGERLD